MWNPLGKVYNKRRKPNTFETQRNRGIEGNPPRASDGAWEKIKLRSVLENVKVCILYRASVKELDMSFSAKLRSVAITFLLASLSFAQTPDVKLPDTAPGKTLTEWLAMCKSPNLEQMTKWNTAHVAEEIFKFAPADRLAKDDFNDCTESGGYRVAEVTEAKPDRVTALAVTNKTEAWFNITMVLDKQDKIAGIGLGPAAPSEATLPKDLSDAAMTSHINAHADQLAKDGH